MKPEAAPFTKITHPLFTGVLPRNRLFAFLDTGLRRSAMWVSGPPGSGKTVLVSSYLKARSLPCLWYQVDCQDADAATFFYYMGIAAKKASPRTKRPLPLLTPEYLPGLPVFTRHYFEDLYSRLKSPYCIVFDNYQDAPVDAQIHEALREGLEVLPAGVKIIFISRGEPPGTLSRMEANGHLKVLGWDELALTVDESEEIIRFKLKEKLSSDVARKLHEMTKGWVACLTLMIEKVKKGVFEPGQMKAVAEDTIFEYFSTEILEKLGSDVRGFLLKTALMPIMDARMAERLTGAGNAGRILSGLYRNNYFTERRAHASLVYQYHPLFREFLLSRAKDSFVDDLPLLKKKAAVILYEAEWFEDAFGLFRDCSEWEWINRLVMERGQSLITQGRGAVLEDWIKSLPTDMLDNGPWLQYYLGLCGMPRNPGESRAHLEKAFLIFRKQKDAAGVFLTWAGIVDSCIFGLDNLKLLDEWIPRLKQIMRSFGGFPPGEIETRVASSMFMALIHRQPQHPEIETWGTRALTLSDQSGDMRLKALTLSNYAFHEMNSGILEEAAIVLDSCRRFTESNETTPLTVLTMKWVEAMYLTYTADNKQCMKVVQGGLDLSASTGAFIMDFLLMGQGALSALDAGDFKNADRLVGRMTYLSGSDPLTGKGYYRFLLAYNAVLHKDFKQAAVHVDIALKQAEVTGFPLAESFCHIEYAQVMHELKEYKKALHHLKKAYKIAKLIRYRYMEFICLLTDALFAFDRETEKAGLALLRKGMALGRECGFINTYTLRPDIAASLCSKALQAGIETEYVQALIKKRNLLPDAPPLDIEDWPWPVKVYTLGRFSLVKDGSPVRFSRKAQQRPIAVLKALITLGGREVSEEKLTDILWPEAEADSSHKAFAIALHRLRRLMGVEKAISFSNGRVTLDARYCWVDIWAFERILGKADDALKNNKTEKAIQSIERAVAMYHGPCCTDDSLPIAEALRERLKNKFLKYVKQLGRLYEERGEFEKAIDPFEKGITTDPFAEELYQRIMLCHRRLGHRTEALAVYDRLKKTFKAIPGFEPSPETKEIYKALASK